MRKTYQCPKCGSRSVYGRLAVKWDDEKQGWLPLDDIANHWVACTPCDAATGRPADWEIPLPD